ncbi:MAG: type II toxin-antitoxin system VapC family toxin [Pseudonocardiaceae bacterium]
MTAHGSLVVDSHAFIWYVQASPRLSAKARQAMDDATSADVPLMISAATLVELVYLVEKGTFSEADVDAFHEILDAAGSGFEVAPLDGAVARAVGRIPRTAVADPFDRMIAATALIRAAPLVTYDRRLRRLTDLETIW